MRKITDPDILRREGWILWTTTDRALQEGLRHEKGFVAGTDQAYSDRLNLDIAESVHELNCILPNACIQRVPHQSF